jgi:hypothetical protein
VYLWVRTSSLILAMMLLSEKPVELIGIIQNSSDF